MMQNMQSQLTDFIELLIKWNKTYNLTAITDPTEIRIKHIADSLAIAPLLHGEQIIDVGTGAGIPGIPLAIVCPEKQFTLLDSNGKKLRFIKQVKQLLALKNITVIHSRVEQYQPNHGYSSVISRAFASICDMLRACQNLACADGRFLAMKGVVPNKELQQLPAGFILERIHNINVDGLAAKRCLIEIKKINE